MTEAPGRKTDAHLSSVPGGEGRAAKIGEVSLITRGQSNGTPDVMMQLTPYTKVGRGLSESG